MQTINVLLAGSNRRLNNQIQSQVLDVCYNQAAVNCRQVYRLDEFVDGGNRERADLMIVTPEHLLPPQKSPSKFVTIDEVVQAIRGVKRLRAVPILALAVSEAHEFALLETGMQGVLGGAFNAEMFRSEVRRALCLPESAVEPEPVRAPLGTLLLRGLGLLKSA